EYPNFYVTLSSSMANSAAVKYFPDVIYGHKATLVFERDQLVIVPEGIFKGAEGRTVDVTPSKPINRLHTDNFLDCMRTRKPTALNPELGYQIMTAIRLGVDSYREGKMKVFDAKTQRIVERGPARPGYEGDGKNPPDSKYSKRRA
ncbi:MAG: hypothetical protein ABIZ80_08045, partial [Bryobacteraceae bacterium]